MGNGKISIDSPVGKTLLGKRGNDELIIKRPAGKLNVTITAIGATRP